jgi:hypothetical protein
MKEMISLSVEPNLQFGSEHIRICNPEIDPRIEI